MKKWFLLALLLLVASYVGTAWHSARQIAETAHREDLQRFQGYIDLPSLRANLKLQLEQRLRESLGSETSPELSDFLTAGANLFIGPLLQGLVTAEGLAALLRGGDQLWLFERELYRSTDRDARSGRTMEERDSNSEDLELVALRFTALDRVAADYGASDAAELRLILERQGVHWRVVDLEFPESEEIREQEDDNG